MARGSGGSGRGPMTREVQVSKKISWLLRHGAEREGLTLGPGGYVNVKEVLNNRNLRSLKVTFAELREVVADNDKQRFSLIPVNEAPSVQETASATPTNVPVTTNTLNLDTSDPSNYLIRANQGHSIKVEEEGLLEPITLGSDLPTIVVHGTTRRAWPLIMSSGGLKKMSRNHVHFATGLPAGFQPLENHDDGGANQDSAPVISGMRNSSDILIFLALKKALEGGLKFWKSANGVILSDGDEDGIIPIRYFLRVEERKRGLGVILRDGEVIQELPGEPTGEGGSRRGGRQGRGRGG